VILVFFLFLDEIQYVKERVMFLLTYASLTRESNFIHIRLHDFIISLGNCRGRYKSQFTLILMAQ
jgi:hypothetical protein